MAFAAAAVAIALFLAHIPALDVLALAIASLTAVVAGRLWGVLAVVVAAAGDYIAHSADPTTAALGAGAFALAGIVLAYILGADLPLAEGVGVAELGAGYDPTRIALTNGSSALRGSLAMLTAGVREVAGGDLTKNLAIADGPLSELAIGLNKLIFGMREFLRAVHENAAHLGRAGMELRETAANSLAVIEGSSLAQQQLDEGIVEQSTIIDVALGKVNAMTDAISSVASSAEQQTRSLDETASSVTSMSASIEEVAAQVDSLLMISSETSLTADRGGVAIHTIVESMDTIRATIAELASDIRQLGTNSAQIGDIVKVIDRIAEQTNLLALNAAIEAARAGEHGRGFAVVADEVRKLAENSARSTKEISQLIKNIQAKTAEVVRSTTASGARASAGLAMADRAGRAIDDILGAVSQATGLIDQISTAAREQAAGSNAIVASVDEMNSLTAEAARSLAEQNTSNQAMMFTIDAMREIAERVSSAVAMQRQACDRIEAAAMLLGASTETGRVATEGIESIAGAMHAHIHAPPTVAPRSNVEDDRLSLGRAR